MTGSDSDIFELALACYRNPLAHQSWLAPAAPLPGGMDRLLWLANGSPEILKAAVRQTGARTEELREAARFLLQQLCFTRGASHYRVLGLQPHATPEQIKEHHRLLIRLFHPDRGVGRANWTDHYASRVNEAWTALSRPQSRADYDDRLRRSPEPVLDSKAVYASESGTPPRRVGRQRRRRVGRSRTRVAMLCRWLPVLVVGGFALVAALLVGGIHLFGSPVAAPVFVASAAPVVIESPVVLSESTAAEPTGHSAIAALLATPNWQMLEPREQQARQRSVQTGDGQEHLEQAPRDWLATDEALLEQMRAERVRLEEQLRVEQAKSEQAWVERLAAGRARLEQLKAEQARAEHARAAEPDRLKRLRLEPRTDPERTPLERSAAVVPAAASTSASIAPDASDLTDLELDDLIGRYTSAYQQRDLNRVMVLFAPGVRGKGGSDRAGIRRDYAALFDTHMIPRMQFHNLRWSRRGPSASAAARYELWLRRRDDDSPSQLAGNIWFEVRKQDGRVLIESIDYDWLGR
jgi:hypothetical protein